VAAEEVRYVHAVRDALADALETDPRAVLIGEEVGVYGGVFRTTEGLLERFGPDRVRDTPIAEASFVGAAVGAAIVGARPIVEVMFMDFIASAMDPIVNHAAKLHKMSGGQINVPVVIRTQGGTGTSHSAQHSQMLESWFTHVPGLQVVLPSTPQDVRGLYRTAMEQNHPTLVIEHRRLYRTTGVVDHPVVAIPFGRAAVRRKGSDVTLVATSFMTFRALEAAKLLAEEGIEAEVIDPRTLVPLDSETILASVSRTNRLVVVHEEVERSGWGAEVVAMVTAAAFDMLDAPPLRLGARNVPMPFGTELEDLVVPQTAWIVDAVRGLFHD
jgi:acetoin:2,6-dichlorophenolindophenol oxidoreductase subunit beta